ncbi:DNA methyltransferase [Litorisediminicola beolgyonensis]|uniref:site-specific DNA-methyltransferase (adenine-specific) n=1 Tax=Litorisediminicola beolgyonensis TaxID=1173614 RepID=A0ABW3ZI84_9RHOB
MIDMTNQLFFGDNLDVMRENIADQVADLIYLDPPFNSDARYNVFFQSPDEAIQSAQAEAFRDTWLWDHEAEAAFQECAFAGGPIASIITALHTALGNSDLMAYLVMMAARIRELRRVLKPTGMLFLHCDPSASHYLKILLDGAFGADLFRNEIVWKRTQAKSLQTRRLPTNHDIILVYAGGREAYWNIEEAFIPYDEANLDAKTLKQYSRIDPNGRRYTLDNLVNPNKDRPNLTYEFLGVKRVWRWTKDRMSAAYDEGLIHQAGPGKVPRLVRYLDEQRGKPLDDVWADIDRLNPTDAERLGYPTQKPLALVERLIRLASKGDATVFDPFCGCGTTVHAAQSLGRNWIGIDIACHAIEVISDRLERETNQIAGRDFELTGIPRDLASAQRLAENDKFQFQWWANHLVGVQQMREVKRGPDRGIDGEMFFEAGPRSDGRRYGRLLTSVKGGKNVGVAEVRDFRGVLEREKADGGLFICLRRPTKEMTREAGSAGFFRYHGSDLPRLQVVSIEEWFNEGFRPRLPGLAKLERTAPDRSPRRKAEDRKTDQMEMLLHFPSDMSDPAGKIHLNPRTAFARDSMKTA